MLRGNPRDHMTMLTLEPVLKDQKQFRDLASTRCRYRSSAQPLTSNRIMQLYLLVPSTSTAPRSVEANGRLWSLQPFKLSDSNQETKLRYSCISYAWGPGRTQNPFDSAFLVSDHTMPALETFIQQRPSSDSIWIDALCVPLTEPERSTTLQSMGSIYARADEVMVVLSSAALPALTRMLDSRYPTVDDLAVLERENWVSRAWTYQEAVNSKVLSLSCEGTTSVSVSANTFFSRLSHALAKHTSSWPSKLHEFPRLNAFEDIMADFYTAAYNDRAALNVMSNMDRRVQERKEDHFYAMIGAITAELPDSTTQLSPCEAFIKICEAKGDFSFVCSAANRENTPGKRWRPVNGDLPSILPWHIYGSGQPGRLSDDGLWLYDMLVVRPARPQHAAETFVTQWLAAFWEDNEVPRDNLEEAAHTALRILGFAGTSQCIMSAEGYFFPFEQVAREQVVEILVSTALQWRMGAPGLVSYKGMSEHGNSYTAGIYVGSLHKQQATSVLLT